MGMSHADSAQNTGRLLIIILRIMGAISLTAIVFVFVPYAWMNSIHQMLDLGVLPSEPIVGYLARSTSAFYALLGGLLIVLSLDVRRCRNVLEYLGFAISIFGLMLVFVDWVEGLPFYWKMWEGPFVFIFGIVLLILTRRIPQDEAQ